MAAGALVASIVYRTTQVKSIPLGEGWWGSGEKPLSEDDTIHNFQVQTSDQEIEVIWELKRFITLKGKQFLKPVTCLHEVSLFNRTFMSALTEPATLIL